ncbi:MULTISPECIES: YsnF/AvaK domain-containing protein [Streptomyces]|uniref:YsnF/AvaK domain-containing protein n=1 Tax=Streptomyces xanthii TaxID=2768069 RepID=A0A7H1B1P8_9ACTN|nr:YsnF/AvaK domain-containing protein [Streptomyces xanthii]QNS02653.1 YsnF/AvaK domain-containing protein [Streptomyces xanthii]
MITQEQIPAVLEHPVHDAEGNKIGNAKHIFYDDATGRPEWVTVKTGLFGSHESFAPIRDAAMVGEHLELPYPKDKVKDAPNVDVDNGGHLSVAEEQRLYDYYGIAWDDAWQRANEPGEGGWAHGGPAAGDGMAGAGGGMAAAAGGTGTAAGFKGPDEAAGTEEQRAGTAERERTGMASGDDAMTRSEERMHVGTERYESGRARLRKYVVTEEVEQTVPVSHEEVRLVREPITEANVDDSLRGPEISEAEHEVTLHAERPVVETEAVPVERVRLTTEERTEERTVTGEVRKEEIALEGVDETGEEQRRSM